jgi:hypothetical protein
MPLSLKLRRDGGGAVRVIAPRDRSPLVVRATTALSQLTRIADAAGGDVLGVQPVVAVSDRAGYARWRAGRERIWRAQRVPYTTAGWPRELPAGTIAAVLLPLPAGTRTAAGDGRKAPRVVAAPLFSTRSTDDGSGPDDIALGLIAEWLRQASTGATPTPLRVAPPLLETTTGERRVLDLGLTWPLAPALAA